MAAKSLPPQKVLLQLLRYEPETGKLYWNDRTPDRFEAGRHSAAHTCARWNSKFAGKEAFTSHNDRGYLHSSIKGFGMMTAHRVIWKMETGSDPAEIDHMDGVRDNNRWSNLADVSRQGNMRNVARAHDNTSGHVGVRFNGRTQKWQAFIYVDRKFVSLGVHSEIDEAVAARKAAEAKYLFHPNHGREAMSQGLPQ